MMSTMRILLTAALAAGIVLAPTAAQARPVHDQPAYCGPGQTHTVYDVRTGGFRTTCLTTVRVPNPFTPWRWAWRW